MSLRAPHIYETRIAFDEEMSQLVVEKVGDLLIIEDVPEPDAEWKVVKVPAGKKSIEINRKAVVIPDPDKPAHEKRVLVKDGYKGRRWKDQVPEIFTHLRYDYHIPVTSIKIVFKEGDAYSQWIPLPGEAGELSRLGKVEPINTDYFLHLVEQIKEDLRPKEADLSVYSDETLKLMRDLS